MPIHLSPLLYRQLKALPTTMTTAWLASVFGVFAYRHGYFNPLNLTVIGHLTDDKNTQVNTVLLSIEPGKTAHQYSVAMQEALHAAAQQAFFSLATDNVVPIAAIATIALIELDALDSNSLAALKQRFIRAQGKLWLAYSYSNAECALHWLADTNDPAFAGPLAERFEVWLNAIAQQPQQPLLMQPLLTTNDNQLIEHSLCGGKVEREYKPVIRQFELHAQSNPSALAVHCLGEQWSYSVLNHKANQLAHHLMALGIGVNDKVAVYLPTCPQVLQCLLAIHKVGAIYIPIDPTLPQARINAMCDTVNPRLMLGLSRLEPLGAPAIPFVAVDDVAIDALSKACPPVIALSEATLSHVFFTSGTTGVPKAVVATQGNLQHYVTTAQEHYRFTADDRFIAAARFTFSISLFELLTPLATGASIELLPREQVLDLAALCAALRRATVFHFGPSLLKQLLPYIAQHYEVSTFKAIRHASSGGDMVPADVLRGLRDTFTQAEIYVIYGSSEISCMGCTYPLPLASNTILSRVGRPFSNVQVRIQDNYGNRVPPGVAGLLEFIGPGVVTGYMNLPELTAERFSLVSDGLESEHRGYQIGDVGRLDNQGNIELLGREDFQVQIRGMRVELVEVEQCLKRHPSIADCLVVAQTLQGHGDASLVAYLVFAATLTIDAHHLSIYLAQHLPDYMVPSIFVVLARLPTNHNNKIDRSQLPLPCSNNILLSDSFCAPEDAVEQTLLTLLSAITGMDGIGTQHNFFELGGDSLQAVQWLTAINQHYQKFIPITYLLEHATVKALARVVRGEVEMPDVGDVAVLKQGDISKAPLFCLYGVLIYRDLASHLDTSRSVCGVYLPEEILLMQDGAVFADVSSLMAVNSLAERYLKSITQYQQCGPYFLCGDSFGGIIALEVARKLKQRGDSVALIAMLDTKAPRFVAALAWRQRIRLHIQQMQNNKAYVLQKLRSKWGLKRKLPKLLPSAEQLRVDARKLASDHYFPERFDDEVLLLVALERPHFEPFIADLGWRQYLPNLTSIAVQGDHFSMLKEGYVHDLAAQLNAYLK